MDLGLAGRACIVTGASSGIGLATVRMLAHEGAHVLLVGRDAHRLEQAIEGVRRGSGEASGALQALAADVRDTDSPQEIVNHCIDHFGAVHVLVNSAGTTRSQPLPDIPDDYWMQQFDEHVLSTMRLMRAAVPPMVNAGWGRIVNVSSAAGKMPSHRDGAYSVAKAAELAVSRIYAEHYAPSGVLVNAVTPGPIATPLWTDPGGLADQASQAGGPTRADVLDELGAAVPRKLLGQADEVAAVIAFLCSTHAANVVGAAWSVDGGMFRSYV